MTANGITQIVLYLVILTVLAYPLGGVHGAGLLGHAARATLARRTRARLLPARRHEGGAGAGLEAVCGHGARLHGRLRRPPLRPAPTPGAPAAQPGRPRRRQPVGRDEHDRQLRHEHELAVLRRRVHDVVPEPDGRARGAELRLGGARHGRARCGDPRLRAPVGEHRRATSGSTSTGRSSTSSCRLP